MDAKKKKKIIIIALLCVLLFIAAAAVVFFVRKRANTQMNMQNPPAMEGMDENVVSASGLTSVGMLEEFWELDFLETKLYVDESYLSTGDEVEAGTAVFHVTEETLEKARKELEDALTEAELAYRQGVIDNATESIEAYADYEEEEINQKYAQTEYESAVLDAAETVKALEEEIEEARELAEEYAKSVNEDYYRDYYQIDELYQNYYEHFTMLMEFYEKWDVEELESSLGMMGQSQSQMSGQEQNQSSSSNVSDSKLSVYNLLDDLVTEEGETYKTALESYEKAKNKAEAGLEQANSNLASLEAELVKAQTEYEKSLVLCKADYETTLAESNNAQTIYETTLQSLEETLASLEDAKTEAEENLALFEETIGDGYFYTKDAGTIVVNGIREDTYLSGETIVIAYNNPETVTVSANVDQSDIAQIAVGDSAYVVVSGYENYQGTVTLINPVTQAQSRSSVTYQVTVSLEGDLSGLDSNLTAYVYFGVTEEMMSGQQQRGEGKAENERAD